MAPRGLKRASSAAGCAGQIGLAQAFGEGAAKARKGGAPAVADTSAPDAEVFHLGDGGQFVGLLGFVERGAQVVGLRNFDKFAGLAAMPVQHYNPPSYPKRQEQQPWTLT